MGMRHGYIAATATRRELIAELERHTGDFVVGAEEPSPYDLDLGPDDEGWVLAAGERDGRAFLLDTSLMLSNEPDMLVAMSQRLGLVAGAGAETVSGSFWLTAARDGELLRAVYVQHSTQTRGMAMGDPLPSERDHPLERFGGVSAALAALGLDPAPWLDGGPAHGLRYTAARFPASGAIDAARAEHHRLHAHPAGTEPRITVVAHE
ncbi:hypothetical protein [Dactylosporangium sp. NPDC005555]|uniref:hypothetical protein n=1 Tax=Dactylosporangium sp. NPDC005555 TaxID=3154889 RepID=UPI0033A05AA3